MENPYVLLGIRKTKDKGGGDNLITHNKTTIIYTMDSEQEEWCHYSDLPSPSAYINPLDDDEE